MPTVRRATCRVESKRVSAVLRQAENDDSPVSSSCVEPPVTLRCSQGGVSVGRGRAFLPACGVVFLPERELVFPYGMDLARFGGHVGAGLRRFCGEPTPTPMEMGRKGGGAGAEISRAIRPLTPLIAMQSGVTPPPGGAGPSGQASPSADAADRGVRSSPRPGERATGRRKGVGLQRPADWDAGRTPIRTP